MKVAALACIFVASPSFAQEPTTLAAYLAAHPVENCLILAAENRKPTLGASGLGAYGRKTVKIGSINAVVPISMVRFDDSLKQVPNFYDGIPRDAKVLYLISTLDSQQWKAAAAGGIGLGDLRGEQRDVFLSILPKPFRWTKYKANADWHVGEKVAEGVLDEKQVQAVRLRIERRMQLNVQFTGSGAYTVTSPDIEAGPPGSVVFERDNAQENNPDSLYGMPGPVAHGPLLTCARP